MTFADLEKWVSDGFARRHFPTDSDLDFWEKHSGKIHREERVLLLERIFYQLVRKNGNT